ncbi:cob(I)alamin adenosyltransferase [Clostridium sp. USBA 49]|jgi:cob(I)alamin adenosyltransferase|uniref:cob(I)yrinic acid a,c-diamide adenosyltransferase n=1 Tax=Clostridium TaxID=1485 RepID=UPI00099AD50E|nr:MULTISPECIES: cob(I)yrinic acid a,c-diamide adenosyltransferase [Clostridium]SKA76150.1 cob(I)alamin adenosyltransferase [Clostridium sp. USBA 49]
MDKIYTKSGDYGYTTNFLGKKCFKGDIEIELQGQIDKVNSEIGFLRSLVNDIETTTDKSNSYDLDNILKKIQYQLYLVGIEISMEFTKEHILEDDINFLEKNIDFLIYNTKPMDTFIYYSGSKESTFSHIIRSEIRKSEIIFARLFQNRNYPVSYKYINRLSDYFFALSRYLNNLNNISDEPLKHIK